jgi:hypothetical protein
MGQLVILRQVTRREPALACGLTSCNDLPIILAEWISWSQKSC